MSSLDRVFIKAYSKDSASTAASSAQLSRANPAPSAYTESPRALPSVNDEPPPSQENKVRPEPAESKVTSPHASLVRRDHLEIWRPSEDDAENADSDSLDSPDDNIDQPEKESTPAPLPNDPIIDSSLSTTALVMPPYMPLNDVPNEVLPFSAETPTVEPADDAQDSQVSMSETPVETADEPVIEDEEEEVQLASIVEPDEGVSAGEENSESSLESQTDPVSADEENSAFHYSFDQAREEVEIEPTRRRIQLGSSAIPAPHFRSNLAKSARREFQPIWEVSRFEWPQLCCHLNDVYGEQIAAAGEKLAASARRGNKVVAFTSLSRGAGCTTLALCLARWAAKSGLRVALIDADMESPQLDTQLGLQAPDGWQQTTHGDLPLNETAIFSIEDRLALAPLKPSGDLTSNSLRDRRMSDILRQASESFDLVVVDVGPIDFDELSAAKNNGDCPIDSAVIVHDAGQVKEGQIESAVALLRKAGILQVSIAENFVVENSADSAPLETALS